ncbi:MAG: hypothetical protein COA80_18885 [Leeuwenhoekiella sp.]|nr:MAG: hypothetical protein COA80_18885 [Leeuwenhoekiella sp.]
MFEKIKKSWHRKTTRAKAKRILSNQPIHNEGVVNLHCLDTDNVGDLFCAPHNYFDKLNNTGVDLRDYYVTHDNRNEHYLNDLLQKQLIVGGGGLLNRNAFQFAIDLFEHLADRGKKTVLWGLGHNSKNTFEFGKITAYSTDVSKFGLVGTRDYSMPGEYVPCVSCMHELFDKSYEVTDEIGIIFHRDTIQKNDLVNKFADYPCTSNTTNLEELLNFIGSKESLITDSYHAMYWSMLLGKKVAVVPNSSKFYDFKYKPVFTNFESALSDLKNAEAYSGILEECRTLNTGFYEKVGNYLNL